MIRVRGFTTVREHWIGFTLTKGIINKNTYEHLTGMHVSTRLLMAMAVFIIIVLTGAVAEKADARASITNYLAKCRLQLNIFNR